MTADVAVFIAYNGAVDRVHGVLTFLLLQPKLLQQEVVVVANSRLTIAVHVLAWMALARQRGLELLTSDQVAASVNTNPVIIRRSLGDLRRAALVDVRHGAGAGWSLAPRARRDHPARRVDRTSIADVLHQTLRAG